MKNKSIVGWMSFINMDRIRYTNPTQLEVHKDQLPQQILRFPRVYLNKPINAYWKSKEKLKMVNSYQKYRITIEKIE